MAVEDISSEDIERWIAGLDGSVRMRNKLLIQVHGILARAKKLYRLPTNAATEVEKFPQRRSGEIDVFCVTSKKKMRAKLKSVKTEMRKRMHDAVPEQGRWLASVLGGRYRYYAVPDNIDALQAFRAGVVFNWQRALSRRSQKGHVPWKDMWRIADRWLPQPRILHPWPTVRFDARTRARSPVR
jgi:hypothetical protein